MKTGHLGDVFGCFEDRVVCGDDDQGKIKGKPPPDILLVAAREKLGRKVGEGTELSREEEEERAKGLVFEDAIPGMQAGKRAGMSGECNIFSLWCIRALIVNSIDSGMGARHQSLRR
jgi:pseudouridine-5'-monophosphatase